MNIRMLGLLAIAGIGIYVVVGSGLAKSTKEKFAKAGFSTKGLRIVASGVIPKSKKEAIEDKVKSVTYNINLPSPEFPIIGVRDVRDVGITESPTTIPESKKVVKVSEPIQETIEKVTFKEEIPKKSFPVGPLAFQQSWIGPTEANVTRLMRMPHKQYPTLISKKEAKPSLPTFEPIDVLIPPLGVAKTIGGFLGLW